MDPLAFAALAIALAALVAAFVAQRRAAPPRGERAASLEDALRAGASSMRDALAELRTANTQALGDLRGEVQRSLGATEQQVLTQTGTTQRTLGELEHRLGALGEQSARIVELAKDIGSLQDLLRAPKARGGFGELLMERVLEDSLPAGAFEVQYAFRNGLRVDAVVHFGDRLVPIDAKFPLESYKAVRAAPDDDERHARRRAFLQQVKKHVDTVARYIAPEEGTIDFALMYIPAEAVFYELLIRDDDDLDLWEHCSARKVIPTSPNTLLGYLRVISLGLRGLAMQERTRELQEEIQRAALEIGRFRELHEQLGRHLLNAANKHAESLRSLDRATDAIASLSRTPLVAPEQARLPLARTPDELIGDALGTRREE